MPYIARFRVFPGFPFKVEEFSTMSAAQNFINSRHEAYDASIDFVQDGF